MKFTNEHLDLIQKFVEDSPISRLEMRENIIDHLCCAVEYKLLNGFEFKPALESALTEFAPEGLSEIEHETYLLLNANSINMKKITYSSGLLFSMIACFGVLLKILRQPLSTEFLIVGFGGLAGIFLPLLSMTKKSLQKTGQEKIRERVFLISLLLFSSGAVLKLLHLASANELLLLGTVGIGLGFLPLTFLKLYREAVAS